MKKIISYLQMLFAAALLLLLYSVPVMAQEEDACNHELQVTYAYEATCTDDGIKEDYYECTKCHAVFADANAEQPVSKEDLTEPAYGHYTEPEHDWDVQKKATTKRDGRVAHPCVECREIVDTVVIPKVKTIKLSFTSRTYNGKTQKPTVKVLSRKGEISGYDQGGEEYGQYKLTFPKSSKKVGRYTVKISFMNFYSGTVTKTYDITPKGTKIVSLSPFKKGFTVKWAKQSDQTDGYQIAYSTSASFKNARTVTVTGRTLTSKKITGLKAKKTYYVKVRTYKKAKYGDKLVNIYSDWSKVKAVRTK